MIRKVDLARPHDHVFGNPAPMGLLGLAIASFALVPISFGYGATREGLLTAAVYALLFGCGCQLLTGLMDFANKNAFGGAIFTTFAFMWAKNAWELYSLANGLVPSGQINFVIDVVLLVVFVVLAYGFGFFSLTLFVFLLDINAMYVVKIVKHLTHTTMLDVPLGILLALLGAIALWITFASLINPAAGRMIFREFGPVFKRPAAGVTFDFSTRFGIFAVLYEHWMEHAFQMMPLEELAERVRLKVGDRNLVPDLFYLMEYGCLVLDYGDEAKSRIRSVRLNASGIDLHEQLVLKKYEF